MERGRQAYRLLPLFCSNKDVIRVVFVVFCFYVVLCVLCFYWKLFGEGASRASERVRLAGLVDAWARGLRELEDSVARESKVRRLF